MSGSTGPVWPQMTPARSQLPASDLAERNDRLRLVFFHVDLPPEGRGGVAYQVDLLARTLVGLGHEVRIFSTTHGPIDAGYEVSVVGPAPTGRYGRVRRQYEVAWAFRQAPLEDHDMIHAHGDDWMLRPELPRVRTFYGSARHEALNATSMLRKGAQRLQHQLEQRSASLATARVAISEHSRRQLPAIDRVIPCAVDERMFSGIGGRSPTTEPSILYVAGSLGGRKRGQVLLDAFGSVRRRWPSATLHLVTRDEIDALGVRVHSNLTPRDLAELYLSAWVYASPSSYEGFGVPYAEAMTAGCPVLATRNPGAEEVLASGRLGRLTAASRFAVDLVDLLVDEHLREQLGRAGNAASDNYSSRLLGQRYLDLYRSVA